MQHSDMIVIKHYRASTARYGCHIVQETDSGQLLFLNEAECQILGEMRKDPITLDQFLSLSLAGEIPLSLRQSMLLIKKLYDNEFLIVPSDRIREIADKAASLDSQNVVSKFSLWQQNIVTWVFPEAATFKFQSVHPILAHYVEFLHHPRALMAGLAAAISLAAWQSDALWMEHKAAFESPVMFLFQTLLGIVVWNVFSTILTAIFIGHRERRGVRIQLRLVARFLPLLTIDDRAVLLWKIKDQIRLRLFTITANLVIGVGGLTLVRVLYLEGLFGLFLANFMWLAFDINPLFDSTFTRLATGVLAMENFLGRTRIFFSQELFKGIVEKSEKKMEWKEKTEIKAKADDTIVTWLIAATTLCFVWLFCVFQISSDVLVAFFPLYIDAWTTFVGANSAASVVRDALNILAQTVIGLSLIVLTLYPLGRFLGTLSQNIWSASRVPVFKARRTLFDYQTNALTSSDAVLHFLQGIPIFSHLSAGSLDRLSKVLRAKNYKAKQTIIQQGEKGHIFFIVAVGQVQVLKETSDGRREIVSTLNPGDSFGEIALLENTMRTASVRAKSSAVMLMLSRKTFDATFPEGGEERQLLTRTIRSMKLIADAQAFSHFTPQEAKLLVRASKFVRFTAGERFINEGEMGDVAYLIENGSAQVLRGEKDALVATVSRGELVGTIALVREMPRTASVVALSDIQALCIPKSVFLNLCLANPVVGVIVQELVQKQLAVLEAS